VFGAPGFPIEIVLMYASCLYYDRNLNTDTVLTPRTYTGTNRAVNVFCFSEPLIQNILEVSREDETYQALNRGRLVLDPSIRLILLTNIVIEQIPVTRLVSLDDVAGRKPDVGRVARGNIVRELIERQLDAIGFISAARTIRPFMETDVRVSRDLARYFADKEAVIKVPKAQKMTRRAVEEHVGAVVEELSLHSFRMFYTTDRSHSYFDIFGRDDSCIRKARHFFERCPGCEGMTLYTKSENDSGKYPHDKREKE
jgi:hypothetical protein